MTVELVGVIALVLGLIGLFLEPAFLVYVFFGATLLGAAAAFVLDSLGGTTIQPAHLFLGILTAKLLSRRDVRAGVLGTLSLGSPGFWLLITAGYAAMSAYVMPRLFMGQTLVFAVRAEPGSYYAAPLVPTMSNLTQSIYFVGDCVCFLVLSSFGSTEAGRKCLGRAALMCVVLNLVFAVLDLATYATNTSELLSFIRNSTYSVLNDNELAGFKRIVGSFVEASSFGYWTLGYFAFATTLWLNGIVARLTLPLSMLSLLALLLSTSTTAYVGLAAYLTVLFATLAFQFVFRPVRPQMIIFLIGAPFVLCVLVLVICLNDASYAYVTDLLNTFILNKMSTGSGIERSSWNNQAMLNFTDTLGFGAGNGSVRASSFPVAVIASLGFLGTAAYVSFLLTIWIRRIRPAPPTVSAMQSAARSACLAWLIAASASGSFIDLGLPFFAFAALACADVLGSRAQVSATRAGIPYRQLSTALD